MNGKCSFKEFLNEKDQDNKNDKYSVDLIVIPKIQRDYAQGRMVSTGDGRAPRLNLTGERFIADIFSVIKPDGENKDLELDFIYGSRKRENNKWVFTPLDGQQRLTTLFLLYWFIGGAELQSKEEKEKLVGILGRFSYETRTSSKDFCSNIVKELKDTRIEYLRSDESISSQIKKLPWFHNSQRRDPTVQSMLNMLDEIQRQYIGKKCRDVYNKLENLRFYVLLLNDFDLTEDLYIKMNARGKQLTGFENFKADLQKWIKNNANSLGLNKKEYGNRQMPFDVYFINKIDNEWSQRFWERARKNGDLKNFESSFLSFVYKYFLNEYILHFKGNNTDLDKSREFKDLEEEVRYEGFSLFKNPISKEKETLANLEILLDRISGHYDEILEVSSPCWAKLQKSADADKFDILDEKLGLKKRTVFCAIVLYLIKKDFNKEALKDWVHVVWNIAENADIDSWSTVAGVVNLLRELAEYSDDIYGLLVDDEKYKSAVKSTQAKNQMDEERRKAKLIRKDPKWADKLLESEAHPFFKGNVSFLIPDSEDLGVFEHNIEMANIFFYEKGISPKYGVSPDDPEEAHIFLRALLSRYKSLSDIKHPIVDIDDKEHFLKKLLKDDSVSVVREAIAEWFKLPTEEEIHSKLSEEIQKKSILNDDDALNKELHEKLYKTKDLISWMYDTLKRENRACQYIPDTKFICRPRSRKDWIYIYGYRNEIITKLVGRGWDCKNDNKCYIGKEIKQIPFYRSSRSGEIDVTKTVVDSNGDEIALKCRFETDKVVLSSDKDDSFSLDFDKDQSASKADEFVMRIIKKFKEWTGYQLNDNP